MTYISNILQILSGGPILKHFEQELNIILHDNQSKIDEKCKTNPTHITEIYSKYISDNAEHIYHIFDKSKEQELLKLRKKDDKFNKYIYKCWKKPIDYLEALIEIAEESAISFYDIFSEQANEDYNLLFFVLQSIHARSLLICRECLTLIKNDYPDGAFSRWRTLYELSVISDFLYTKKSQELCERYIYYQYVQEYNDENCLREEGNKNYTDYEFNVLKSNFEYLQTKYGNYFSKRPYGWASDSLNKKSYI